MSASRHLRWALLLVPATQAELRQALSAALAAEEQLELAESRTGVVEKAYAAAVEVRGQGSVRLVLASWVVLALCGKARAREPHRGGG